MAITYDGKRKKKEEAPVAIFAATSATVTATPVFFGEF